MRQITDTDGSVLMAQTFDPYGNVYDTQHVTDVATTYGFAGEQTDASGLIYLRARYYNPSQGRFLNMDPSRLEMNPYQYAVGNPVMYTDPSGLCWMNPSSTPLEIQICTDAWEERFGAASNTETLYWAELSYAEFKSQWNRAIDPSEAAIILAIGGGGIVIDGPIPIGDIIGACAVLILVGANIAMAPQPYDFVATESTFSIESSWSYAASTDAVLRTVDELKDKVGRNVLILFRGTSASNAQNELTNPSSRYGEGKDFGRLWVSDNIFYASLYAVSRAENMGENAAIMMFFIPKKVADNLTRPDQVLVQYPRYLDVGLHSSVDSLLAGPIIIEMKIDVARELKQMWRQ